MNPIKQFRSFNSFDIKLRVINSFGCINNKMTEDLIIVENIIPNISSDSTSGCIPFYINFFDATNSIRPITNWTWDFGNGNTSNMQNPINEYNNAGVFSINLEVENDYGCINRKEFTDYIRVDNSPDVNLQVSNVNICINDFINFTDLSSTPSLINSWKWDFGDGNISYLQNPAHAYSDPGTYNIKLVVNSNGCSDSIILNNHIEVFEPKAFFIDSFNCINNLSVDFWNLSTGNDIDNWNFGDGSTSNNINPTHIFPSSGTYTVTLEVMNFFCF